MVIVLFETELRQDADLDDYEARSERMNELVRKMPGCVSVKRYTAADGDEVVIARFASEEALDTWRLQPEHVETQRKGREEYYESCSVAVCTTIRAYAFHRQAVTSGVDSSEVEASAAPSTQERRLDDNKAGDST